MTSLATPDPYIDGYLKDLRSIGREPTTIETYTQVLYYAHRHLPEGLPYAHADELRDLIFVEGRTPAARHVYRAAIGGFFAHACDVNVWGDVALDYDPTQHLPTVRVPRRKSRTIPTAQLGDILAQAREPFHTWFLLAAGEGLRCIEISRLDHEHVSPPPGDTWVQGKGSKERLVPTHPAVWAAVKDLPPGPVARARDDSRASRQQVQLRGNRYLRVSLGHVGVTMHRLRHWYATNVNRAAGGDIRLTQDLLGHASMSTTQIYVDVDDQAKRAAMDALLLPIG